MSAAWTFAQHSWGINEEILTEDVENFWGQQK
jgi:hypothetical protein